MADNDKKKSGAGVNPALNLADMAPEGYEGDVANVYRTGLLTPLYLPKFAAWKTPEGNAREGFAPVLGWFDRIHIMPEQTRSAGGRRGKATEDDTWVPFNLSLRDLKYPTKGIRRNEIGEITEKSIVEVAAGERILVPITGQISVNQDIMDVLLDLDHVYWMVVNLPGYRKVNNLNPMADWEINFLCDSKKQKIKKKREGEFILPDWYRHAVKNGDIAASIAAGELVGSLVEGAETETGERFDPKTGELLPNRAQAPAMS